VLKATNHEHLKDDGFALLAVRGFIKTQWGISDAVRAKLGILLEAMPRLLSVLFVEVALQELVLN
jgi:hypothetical protein